MNELVGLLTSEQQSELKDILSAAGNGAINAGLAWIENYKQRKGIQFDIFTDSQGRIYKGQSADEAIFRSRQELEELARAEEKRKQNRIFIIVSVAIVVLVGVGAFILNNSD